MATNSTKKVDPATASNRTDILRIVSLVTGDILVFLIFAMIGRSSHSEQTGLNALIPTLVTALPFIIAWFVVSPFLGAYKRDVFANPQKMAKRTLLAWLCAWPLGVLLRGAINGHIPDYTFWIIAFVANAVIISLWRVPFAMTNDLKQREAAQRLGASAKK